MAPTNFQIYVDPGANPPPPVAQNLYQSDNAPIKPRQSTRPRFVPDVLGSNQRFAFDERKIYPIEGGEFSLEEINLNCWRKRQNELAEKKRIEDIQRENETLRQKVEALSLQLMEMQRQQMDRMQPSQSPKCRLSVIPKSLQPDQCMDTDISLYKEINDGTSVLQDLWRHTQAPDKFTVPIDQSQYIRDNIPTSTPNNKRIGGGDEDGKRSIPMNSRRISRQAGGSPTLNLSPITETSRDGNSKSSSSSSSSNTPSTVKKVQPIENLMEEPERVLDPNDPTSYTKLLNSLNEPLDRRPGYFRHNRGLPTIRQGTCLSAGVDSYLVNKVISLDARLHTGQLLNDDSNESSMDIPIKDVCLRVDQPANEWLFYVCNELHRRLAKLKTKPDIELSVMMANPAIMYADGSVMIDEYFRYITLDHFFEACHEANKPFPKSIAAYITLELIQLIRQLHACEIIHMKIHPKNILITCCPTREDIANVGERTTMVKLIGFDRAMDTRLLPVGFKFEDKLDDLLCCQMMDSQPWSFEVDWFGALSCIYKMFFLQDMSVSKTDDGRWKIDQQFKGCPTTVWFSLFDELLNITDLDLATSLVDRSVEELNTWIKANVNFVLKEAVALDQVVETHCKGPNKSQSVAH